MNTHSLVKQSGQKLRPSDLSVTLTFPVIGCVLGAVEIPSYLVGSYAMDRVGRKKTCAPALILAGIACMLMIVVPSVRTELCTPIPCVYMCVFVCLHFLLVR